MIASWRAEEPDEPFEHIWTKQQELEVEQQQLEEQEQTYKIWHGQRIGKHIGEHIGESIGERIGERFGEPRRRRASEPIIHRWSK